MLQEDEAVISCGIRFFPSGAKFTQPVKVTLDHNAHFTNPRRAEIVFYTRHKDMNSFVRIPASTEGYPRCDIRTKDLDLFVDHFCEWWIVTTVKVLLGKRFNCTPYLEGLQPVCKGLTSTVRLYISDDLNDVTEKVEGKMEKNHRELAPSKTLLVKWRSGDVVISLLEYQGEQEVEVRVGERRIPEQKLFRLSPDYETFWVKSSETETKQRFFKFYLYQDSTQSDKTDIRFTLEYERTLLSIASGEAGPSHSLSPSSSPTSPLPQCSAIPVSDWRLQKLADDFPHGKYNKLCLVLGESTNKAQSRLATHTNNYKVAVREVLNEWKTRTGGCKNELIEVLRKSEVGGLVSILG